MRKTKALSRNGSASRPVSNREKKKQNCADSLFIAIMAPMAITPRGKMEVLDFISGFVQKTAIPRRLRR